MKKFLLVLFVLPALSLPAQKFRPYTAYGFEANLVWTALPGNSEVGQRFTAPAYGPFLAQDLKPLMDVKFSYNYAPLKWLGLGTGAGLSVRGGEGYGPSTVRSIGIAKKTLYYFNIPLRVQLKAGFFWLEPGLQTNVLLWMNNQNGEYTIDLLQQKDCYPVQLSASLMGRFNIFRGLSLSIGHERWLTPVAKLEYENNASLSTTYYQLGWVIGLRYMINQPY